MSHRLANAVAASARESGPPPESLPTGVLRGAARPDLIQDELLCEIFAATVAARPEAVAMTTEDLKLTYAEVDAKAEAVARGLLRRGVRPGDVVGLWMPRGCELLVAQIAIAKTGAAWLPFDGDAPLERIAICLGDAEAKGLVVSALFEAKLQGDLPCAAFVFQDLREAETPDAMKIDARALGATADGPAYVIYTSGSTGTPKGIVISNANICHYLRAANVVYGLRPDDVVFQGASIAFDLSMEEIWLPYMVGAGLLVASQQILGEAEKLPAIMEANGVTVLDTVPTLLTLLPRDVATLRLIILGGEACPPALASRWCRPGRTIFNSYGPTEATVVATIAEVKAGAPVTIGGPIPNYTCYVADEALALVGPEVEGELLIGGPGVARGYLRREQLTAEKFIANPFRPGSAANGEDVSEDAILYRSGDAVEIDADGNILFRGRIDDQVKVRGFRVELGEIEARLAEAEGVAQAAVALRADDGIEQLVAFIVAAKGAELETRSLRADLRTKLPPYMWPSRYEYVESLPKLSSGKIDRKRLKAAPLTSEEPGDAQEDPRTETEARLLDAARRALPPQAIPFDADFFTDLGGHSLLAARFVSIVRETPALARITLQDVYAARSLRAMAELLDTKWLHAAVEENLSFAPPPLLRRFLCGLAQAVALPVILGLVTLQWLGVFVSYMLLTGADATFLEEVFSLIGVYMCINVATVALVIAAKWLIIGRTRPGRYPIWGVYYFRWWLVRRFLGLVHIKWFQGSPIIRLYLRALGAQVGDDAIIGEVDAGAVDLVSIGAGASIGSIANFANARIEGNELVIGSIDVGARAYIGSSCVIENDVVIGEGAELQDLTSVGAGGRIGARESWDGSPARKVGMANEAEAVAQPTVSPARRRLMTAMYVVLLLAIPPLGLLPIFPAFWVFDRIDDLVGVADIDRTLYMASIPVMAWPTAFVMVLVTVGFIAVCRWTILPFVREGTYSVHSFFYFRKWAVALATEVTLETLSSLYATTYMRAWYRLMGAKIGKDAEISTNLSGRYDLVEIGEKCFIADEVVLGDEEIRDGWMYLKKVRTGPRVFVGNNAVVPTGADIPAYALIGIKSKPPANHLMREGDTWFGSPPIRLPVRQKFDGGGANWTYEAPRWKKIARAAFEAVMVSMPTMLFITFGTWAVEWFSRSVLDGRYLEVLVLFIIASVAICVALTVVVIVLKWITMGRYEPMVKPMWSWWAMRTEAVAVIYWGMAGKVLLDHLRGTPFLPWILRLFGSKFGRGVYMDTTDLTEFDCVSVGDFVSLNNLCALQTHLYEDRVMKVGKVFVGDGVTVGAGSTILYDTVVSDYARLGPLTLVMKGEEIPANTEWVGAPAEPKDMASATQGADAVPA